MTSDEMLLEDFGQLLESMTAKWHDPEKN